MKLNHLLQELHRCSFNPFRVPKQETLDIIGQTLIALGHCHLHFCIHRDIKPENLLMTSDGTVKVGDFGFERVLSELPSHWSKSSHVTFNSQSDCFVSGRRGSSPTGP